MVVGGRDGARGHVEDGPMTAVCGSGPRQPTEVPRSGSQVLAGEQAATDGRGSCVR